MRLLPQGANVVTKKLFVALGAVGMMMAAGTATALTFGSTNLYNVTVNCSLAANKSLPACNVPTATYISAG